MDYRSNSNCFVGAWLLRPEYQLQFSPCWKLGPYFDRDSHHPHRTQSIEGDLTLQISGGQLYPVEE